MNMIIKGTPKTPHVRLNKEGEIFLEGRSIPENTLDFYDPINKWLDGYCLAPKQQTVMNVKLEYFNTSSSKCLLDLFKKLERLQEEKYDVLVNWFFEKEDEDMQEAGEDYRAIVNVPFQIIEVNEF